MKEETLNEFKMLFKQHLNNNKQAQIKLALCKNVNWDERTMTAVGINDNLEYYDVWLGLGAISVKPKVNTECLIGIVEGQDNVSFLIDASEVEEIIYNGGELGGLCNVPELRKQLKKLTARVDGIVDAIKQGVPSAGAPDSGLALKTSIVGFLNAIIDKEDFNDIEDINIKH